LNSDTCFHLNPLFQPLWREWEGEYLVYDHASGNTHRFDSITASLLMRLQSGPASSLQLTGHVADVLAFEPDEALTTHVNEVLLELTHKDFVSTNLT